METHGSQTLDSPGGNGRAAGGPNRFSRRTLVLGGGAAVAVPLLPGANDAKTTVLPDSEIYGPNVEPFWAVFGEAFGPRTCVVVGTPPGQSTPAVVPVGLAAGPPGRRPIIMRDGAAKLSDFERGDELLLGGRWFDRGFGAYVIEQSYRSIAGHVKHVSRKKIVTTAGIVRLTDDSQATGLSPRSRAGRRHGALVAKPLSKLREGDYISVVGRRNGVRDELVGLSISTRI
ncbi:MAG: hypothetical protein M3340_15375 [Actinomycetota bacterium]|nr:hypothetical protein [Actinomycetota bacterium]